MTDQFANGFQALGPIVQVILSFEKEFSHPSLGPGFTLMCVDLIATAPATVSSLAALCSSSKCIPDPLSGLLYPGWELHHSYFDPHENMAGTLDPPGLFCL